MSGNREKNPGGASDDDEGKRTESALKESVRQWTATFNAMRDAICLLDPDGTILRCNRAMKKMVGKLEIEMIGRPCWEVVHGADAPVAGCPRLKARESLKREHMRVRIGGQHLEVAVDPITDSEGALTGYVHIVSDVTERNLMEETLLSVSKQWEDTFNAVEDAIIIIDRNYMVTQANTAARDLFGGGDVAGKHCHELFHGTSKPFPDCRTCGVFKTGLPEQVEIREKHLGDRWFSVRAFPVKDGNGVVQHCVHITTDISGRKRAEDDWSELRQRLTQTEKLSALGEMISGVAHELNNPLSAILGFSQLMLLEKERPVEELAKDISKVVENAERCQRIVKNLLVFARRHKPEKKVVDIVDVIEDVIALREYQLRVEDIGIFRTYLDGDSSIKIYADKHQIHQVLLNLINNAEYAVRATGIPGSIMISVKNEAGDVIISVEDTGEGIRPDDLTRIFDPFFTTKEPGVGTGLGLSVSYGIIQEHGGNIWVKSERGRGATFFIRLPASEGALSGSMSEHGAGIGEEHGAGEVKGNFAGRKILVIDDEAPILNIMERVLRREGYVVQCADNGEKAIALLRGKTYDLIISDMKMPEVSGEAIYDFIKENRPELAGKVLFTTGDTVNEATRRFFDDSGVAYLGKPFSVSILLNAVKEVLARCEETS